MDHLLEHEGEAVPASGGGSGSGPASGSTAGAAMDVDDDEDADAAALGIGVTEGVEAKVRFTPLIPSSESFVYREFTPRTSHDRASNVRSVARRSGIPPWRISTPRRAGTISLRKVQKRCVVRDEA